MDRPNDLALTFSLTGTRLIEASAGTGKTYTIAALYVRLILGHGDADSRFQRPLLPSEILVVTFTDAATKELRDRIRVRLTQTARYFRQREPEADEFMAALREDYPPQDWAACARTLEVAANSMDEAAVFTIHGWCNRMLQQHAFNSGSLFRQEVDNGDSELLNEVLRDYWRTHYSTLSPETEAFNQASSLFGAPDDLLKMIKPLLKTTAPVEPPLAGQSDLAALLNAVQGQFNAALQSLKAPWGEWLPDIQALLEDAIKQKVIPASKLKTNNREDWLDKIKTWSTNPEQVALKLGTGYERLTPQGLTVLVNDDAQPPTHPGFEAIRDLPEALARLPSLKLELVKHAIHWIRSRYEKEKQRLARMEFDDMLTRLDDALHQDGGERLAEVIRAQHPVALIDEFQDTDPVQYRIFQRLYGDQGNMALGCFLIGDPKQAIYSFRGADIFTYLKAHQATQGRQYSLERNFRSTQSLVEAVNRIFNHADQQPGGAFRFRRDAGHDQVAFVPVQGQGRERAWRVNGAAAPALSLWHLDADQVVGVGEYRAEMAGATASHIVHLLNLALRNQAGFQAQDGTITALRPADIAILVRTGVEARVVQRALRKSGIRSVYLSDRESIFATGEAADVLLWLKACADPRAERRVRAAIGTITLNLPPAELHGLVEDDLAWEKHLERFQRYADIWKNEGILPMLRRLMGDYGVYGRLMRGESQDGGERRLTNLLHLAELLQKASTHLEGEQALIRHLVESIQDAKDQDGSSNGEDAIIRLESDDNLIQIVTLHKSKGLEYPLVFLPFICSFKEVNDKYAFYRYHDENHELRIDLSKDKRSRQLSDAERLQEDLRLLYVGVTRARYACWLGMAPLKNLERSALGHVLGWQAGDTASALAGKLTALKGGCAHIDITPLPEPEPETYRPPVPSEHWSEVRLPKTRVSDTWWIASYSALQTQAQGKGEAHTSSVTAYEEAESPRDDKQQDESENAEAQATPAASGVHALPRGATPGTLIHALLENSAHHGFSAVAESAESRQSLISELFGDNPWQDLQPVVEDSLQYWLEMPLLHNSNVRLRDLQPGAYQPELEFLLDTQGVNVLELDQWVTRHVLPGRFRPRLLPNTLEGMLKGFIDLAFAYEGHYYVADYKFNALGQHDADYTTDTLERAILDKRYDLQAALYLLALHRQLKARLGDSYDVERDMGGAIYLFLRGKENGRYFIQPTRVFLDGLDDLFAGRSVQAFRHG